MINEKKKDKYLNFELMSGMFIAISVVLFIVSIIMVFSSVSSIYDVLYGKEYFADIDMRPFFTSTMIGITCNILSFILGISGIIIAFYNNKKRY